MSGGFNPSPRRTGAAGGSLREVILEGLLSGMGAAFSDDPDGYAYAESFAEARVLADLFSASQRLAYQWDPRRMTDFLGRWENILGLHPVPGTTDNDRRAAVAAKMALVGVAANIQGFTDLVAGLLGGVFVQLNYLSWTSANMTVPGGAVVPSGPTIEDGNFGSAVAYIDIETAPTSGMSDQEFYDVVARLTPTIDDFLPAWAESRWHRNGPGGAGFFLDDPHNLDNEAFT